MQIMTSVSDIMLLSNLQVKNKPHYKLQLLCVSCAWFGHEQLANLDNKPDQQDKDFYKDLEKKE